MKRNLPPRRWYVTSLRCHRSTTSLTQLEEHNVKSIVAEIAQLVFVVLITVAGFVYVKDHLRWVDPSKPIITIEVQQQ